MSGSPGSGSGTEPRAGTGAGPGASPPTVAYLDAPAGIAGDMFLGVLVDAGLPLSALEEVVSALGLAGRVEVRAERVRRGPLAATKVHVLVGGEPAEVQELRDAESRRAPSPSHEHESGQPCEPEHPHPHPHEHPPEHPHGHPPEHPHGHPHEHPHRTLGEVLAAVRGATALPAEAIADAVRTFELLAAAEATVHGTRPEAVRFHEVGAADALVDVVGTCVGLRRLGVRELRVGPLPWSTGTVRTAHGALPLPAPAVAHLLVGHPTFPSGEAREEVTPTGAALVRALAAGSTPPAGFVPRQVGTGAGTHPGGRLPNVVRLVIGEVAGTAPDADVVLLATNVDDLTGQEAARAIDLALAEGALDAWATPIVMKKGRPALTLSVLARAGDALRLEALLFRETRTLGVRRHAVARTVLARREVSVMTPWGAVRMKVRETPDGPEATPEHDDALALAARHGVALRRVLEAADRAWAAPRDPALG